MKKKLFTFILLPIFLGVAETTSGQPRVTLMLEHEVSSPWTNMLRDGLKKAQMDFNILANVVIASPDADQTAIFRKAASESDLLIVTGENLHEILRDNAGNFRNVMFGCIDAGIRASNIMSVTFADQEAAFLAGAAAAMLTAETTIKGINNQAVLGWLSGMDTPAMRTLYNGFQEGARLVNPKINIAQALVGSFTDSELAREKTAALLSAGADVIVLAAGAGNSGAADELKKFSAWQIGMDQPVEAANLVGTICKAADKAIYQIIKSHASAQFQARQILVYNLENGGVSFDGIQKLSSLSGSKASINISRRINELRNEIIKKAIHIRSLRTRTLCDCLD